ncbi:MAG: magnesium transporter MgtE N-terminal domain-containing protein [Terriglobales bacterium]
MALTLALTELLGAPVYDSTGTHVGRVREVALCPQDDPNHVTAVVVRTKAGDRLVSAKAVDSANGGVRTLTPQADWPPYASAEGMLLLGRDLLDQQIIDVHGRKVVRVNDVDLLEDKSNHYTTLRVGAVDIGSRGAVRRLLMGLVPLNTLRKLLAKIPEKPIPWEFVDLIETDPARRVRLKISHERLAKLHPADIADIVEELTPAEREAVFETLDEEVAAEALEEVTPRVQQSIIQSLDSDRAADIVEEMDPDAAADLLGDLPPERSEEILGEMEPEERAEVEELLEFREDTAAGRMTTDYIALGPDARVEDAIEALRNFEGGIETVSTVYLVGDNDLLVGAVPLPKLVLAAPGTPLVSLSADPVISVPAGASEKEVADTFDKYNLLTLPVVDEQGRLTGVITADDVISLLRSKL